MKKTILFAAAALFAIGATAQDLPQPSPGAKVEQRVGLTDVTVAYSSPGVKERKIWGELVPHGEIWRTGANKATAITFTDDVKVNGTDVKAGSYSFFAIPGESEWELILNTNTELWGAGGYEKEKDALRVKVMPQTAAMRERLAYSFDNMTGNSADLILHWEKLMVSLKIEANVDAKAQANIQKALEEAEDDKKKANVYRNAANYCFNQTKEYKKGLEYVNKSIELNDYWYTRWVKAELEAATKNYKVAIEDAQKAKEMGAAKYKAEERDFTYGAELDKLIEEWKKAS